MNAAGKAMQRLARATWPTVHRRWLAFWGGLERFLGAAGRGISIMVTPAGSPYWAHFLLFLSVILSWLTSPVQGGVKGRSATLFAYEVDLLYGVTKPWKLLSYGTVLLGLLAFGWISRRFGRRPRAYYTLMGVIALFLVVSWLGCLALARPHIAFTLGEQLIVLHPDLSRFLDTSLGFVANTLGPVQDELWFRGRGTNASDATGIEQTRRLLILANVVDAQPVPEPGSLLLVLGAALAAAVMRRRRRVH